MTSKLSAMIERAGVRVTVTEQRGAEVHCTDNVTGYPFSVRTAADWVERCVAYHATSGDNLTVAEAARLTGIPKVTLDKARTSGRLACTKVGQGQHAIYLVEPSELVRWAETYRPR